VIDIPDAGTDPVAWTVRGAEERPDENTARSQHPAELGPSNDVLQRLPSHPLRQHDALYLVAD
jgi:hypothetical protein